eukprot:5491716-Pyramimonas_sp.AAC.1
MAGPIHRTCGPGLLDVSAPKIVRSVFGGPKIIGRFRFSQPSFILTWYHNRFRKVFETEGHHQGPKTERLSTRSRHVLEEVPDRSVTRGLQE